MSAVLAVYPAAQAVVVGMIISRVERLTRSTATPSLLLAPLALFGALLLLQQAMTAVNAVLGEATARRIDGNIRREVRAILSRADEISPLEHAATQDALAVATGGGGLGTFSVAFSAAVSAASGVIGIGAAALVVARLDFRLSLVYAALLLVGRRSIRRQATNVAVTSRAQVATYRRRAYFATLHQGAANEARVYGLDQFILDRHNASHADAIAPILAAYWSRQRAMLVMIAAGASALAGIGIVAIKQVVDGALAVGTATSAILAAHSMLVFMTAAASPNAEAAELFAALRRLHELVRDPTRTGSAHQRPGPAGTGGAGGLLRLTGVSFSYPGSATCVLDGIDFAIDPGESVAVVGVNGAGKTSLMKLIAGLYSPTEGTILVHGRPLDELTMKCWRSTVAAVFQDFARYPLSVRQNITLGVGEIQGDAAAITEALSAAGAIGFVEALPAGVDTVLSKQFQGGVDLSGGEWQRLALARAIYAAHRGASLVLLDEPTSNLDVRGELETFDRLLAHAGGAAALIVSHRFSTVRRADRIVVLKDGRVFQQGSHARLMRAGGLYRDMFLAQASMFATLDPARGRSRDA
ncbi:MAG: ATP-binding cassette, subfamily bacterial [Actinomycetota bacterium]|nr:ATP-binding cassette, subfamily bacterial [Actinomycetota bacterium]